MAEDRTAASPSQPEFERGRSDVRYQLLSLSSWERAGYRAQWERLARGGKRGRDRAYCLGILWELRTS